MLNPTSDSVLWCLTLLPISCRDAWPISCHNAWSYFRFRAVMLDPTSILCRDATSDYLIMLPLLDPFRFRAVMLLPITWWYFRFRLILLPISCCDDTSVCLIPSDFAPWCYFRLLDDISDCLILLQISCRDATSDLLDPTSDFVPWYTSDCLMLFPILFCNATSDSYFWYWCYFCFCILTWS